MAEAQGLGGAAAEANRSARAAYDDVQGSKRESDAAHDRRTSTAMSTITLTTHTHDGRARPTPTDDGEHYFEPPAEDTAKTRRS